MRSGTACESRVTVRGAGPSSRGKLSGVEASPAFLSEPQGDGSAEQAPAGQPSSWLKRERITKAVERLSLRRLCACIISCAADFSTATRISHGGRDRDTVFVEPMTRAVAATHSLWAETGRRSKRMSHVLENVVRAAKTGKEIET